MNIGQILETHLGWVAANGWYDDGSDSYKAAHSAATNTAAGSNGGRTSGTELPMVQ
jgi:DNA-directed RNA polymerase beta subunit